MKDRYPFRPGDDRLPFNERLLELARHNGFAIDLDDEMLTDPFDGEALRLWRVPPQLVPIAGDMILVVPA